MKPRPVKITRTGFDRSERPPPEGWPEKTNPFDDPEDKTPVAPAPSLALLADAGAPWYSRYRYLIIAAVSLTLILTAFLFGLRAATRPATVVMPAPAAAPVIVAAPSAPAPSLPETIVLSVTVSPPTAQVLIDGQLMPSNPFLTRFPRSTATHKLRAVAPGHQPKERWVSFADNVMLDISLSPLQGDAAARDRNKDNNVRRRDPTPPRHLVPPPGPPPPAVVPPPHRPAADIAPRPDGEKPRRRRIEASDPYAGDQ
jgi:hypothetical protein